MSANTKTQTITFIPINSTSFLKKYWELILIAILIFFLIIFLIRDVKHG